MVLRIIGIKKSTFYRWRDLNTDVIKIPKLKEGTLPGYSYRLDGSKINDLEIQKLIITILSDETGKFYGYKKVTAMLRDSYLIQINKKKVYRLMRVLGVLKLKKRFRSPYKRICKNHKISESNVLWEMDTKYVYIAHERRMAYLVSVIDVFDRSIVGSVLSLSANSISAKKCIIKSLYNRGIKGTCAGLTLRTDNGSQFVAYDFEKLCIQEDIIHERIPTSSPNYNAHIESFHRYFQDECLAGKLFQSFEIAEDIIMDYIERYNNVRIHSSINYKKPNEFYKLKNCEFKNKLTVTV